MRITEVLNYLDGLYIPVKKLKDFQQLRELIYKNGIRPIGKDDENMIYCNCLIIKTKAHGIRETYSGYEITRIDIGKVSKTMVSASIFNTDSNRFEAKRFRRLNKKINILEERRN